MVFWTAVIVLITTLVGLATKVVELIKEINKPKKYANKNPLTLRGNRGLSYFKFKQYHQRLSGLVI